MTMVQQITPEDIPPHAYIVLAFTQQCACCRRSHRWSECYALTHLRPSMGLGKRVTNLHRIDAPQYDLPIEVRRQPVKTIPFCHDCNEPTLHDLPPPPPPPKQYLGTSISPPVPLRSVQPPKVAAKTHQPRPTLLDLARLLG